MSAHFDTLDQPERLGKWLAGSIVFHAGLVGTLFVFGWWQGQSHATFGDINGGRFGPVAVNPVSTIPLPERSGPVNPVANPTESRVPEPPPKPQPKPEVKPPEPEAIPLPSKNVERHPEKAASPPNKFREKQQDLPNQLYNPSGQALVTPMVSMPGSGGVSLGTNSPFGLQFGWYANLLRDRVAQHWRTTDIDPRVHSLPPAVVTFTIQSDGSVPPGSIRVVQQSGNFAMDTSARRAIIDSAPLPPLPQGFPHNSADVEFTFELRR